MRHVVSIHKKYAAAAIYKFKSPFFSPFAFSKYRIRNAIVSLGVALSEKYVPQRLARPEFEELQHQVYAGYGARICIFIYLFVCLFDLGVF